MFCSRPGKSFCEIIGDELNGFTLRHIDWPVESVHHTAGDAALLQHDRYGLLGVVGRIAFAVARAVVGKGLFELIGKA